MNEMTLTNSSILGCERELEKALWASPMGKAFLAKRIIKEIPRHTTYVEPFAGGARVLFAKPPSKVEVINDADPEIAFAFRFVKNITEEQVARLRRKPWIGDRSLFERLLKAGVSDDPVERFYRFSYLTRFSFNRIRRGAMPFENVGVRSQFINRVETYGPRLKNVVIRGDDYEKVVQEFDGSDTCFFLDPPYRGHDADSRSSNKTWDEERFAKVLRSIRGKFICTYGLRGNPDLFKGFNVRRWRHHSGVGANGIEGSRSAITLVVTNYDPTKAQPHKIQRAQKTIWSSPAGKKRLAPRLISWFPEHKTYVEPFAGSSAVLLAKSPSEIEVIGDTNLDSISAYRIIKELSKDQFQQLQNLSWSGNEHTFRRLLFSEPNSDLQRLYRFLYLTVFSYGRHRRSVDPYRLGSHTRIAHRAESYAPRLRHTKIFHGDYEQLIHRYDSPDTLFFLDPPYAGFDSEVGERKFDEQRFFRILQKIRGKFLLTYGNRGSLPKLLKSTDFNVRRIRTRRTIGAGDGDGFMTQLVVTNYKLQTKTTHKSLNHHTNCDAFSATTPLIKGVDPTDERYVLGVVLEPESVDAQGDIYSAAEIRQAAHRFMEQFGGLGLMHRMRVNGDVKILESYIAPAEFTIGQSKIRKGTWLLAVRVLSDELWAQVRNETLTGFSIGGSARRVPENPPDQTEGSMEAA